MSGARTVPRAVGITAVRDPVAQHHDVYPDVLVHCGGCALHADEQHYDVCDTFTLEFCLPHGIGEQGHSRHKDSFEHHVDDGELHHDVEGYALMQYASTPHTTDVQCHIAHHDAHDCTCGYGYGMSSNSDEAVPLRRPAPLRRRRQRRAALTTATRRYDDGAVTTNVPSPPHQHSSEIRDIFVASCIGVRMHAQRTDSVTFSFRATVSIPASAPHR